MQRNGVSRSHEAQAAGHTARSCLLDVNFARLLVETPNPDETQIMKRILFTLCLGSMLLASGTGCRSLCGGGCSAGGCGPAGGCGSGGGFLSRLHGRHEDPNQFAQPGPASPTVVYPYYTVRAPRDFLADDPPSIGR